jgi:ribonuclease P protein component
MRIPSLTASRDFGKVLSSGRRRRVDGVQVVALRRLDPSLPTRLGLSARAQGAVQRNLVRRRLRAAAGSCLPPAGWDVVVSTDRSVVTLKYQELEERLCRGVREVTA